MITATYAKFFAKIIAIFTAAVAVFGTFIPSITKDAATYHDTNIKNVIFLIGDGMGYNHLDKTKKELGCSLVMETFPYNGSSRTRSLTDSITDSAAGGSALSTGIHLQNETVGVFYSDKEGQYNVPKNLSEFFKEKGKLTGIVTTDETTGATPSDFSAHCESRYNTQELTEDQMASDLDLIWGGANGVATKEMAEKAGFTYVTDYNGLMALTPGKRSYAQFVNPTWTLTQSEPNTPNLEQMAKKAIELLNTTDNGFFLMIEGAHIDKNSHKNNSKTMMQALKEFDQTVNVALDFAKKDGHTLVVITADHETGGIALDKNGNYVFTQGYHSASDVPVFVYGSSKILETGETLNNYDIPRRIAYLTGATEEQFPCAVKVS